MISVDLLPHAAAMLQHACPRKETYLASNMK